MENFDLRGFAPNYDNGPEPVVNEQFLGQTPGKRISDEQFEQASAAISAETQELIQKEIMRQLQQVEPIYKLTHGLRIFVSQAILQSLREHRPMEIGFDVMPDENLNINAMTKKVEQTLKFLNVLFEDMQGMSTEITAAIRRLSLGLQTQLAAYTLKFKEYSNGGELDRSSKSEYLQDLMDLQMILGTEEINLELIRGKIR